MSGLSRYFVAVLLSLLVVAIPPALGAESELDLQELGFLAADDTPSPVARAPRPASLIAENVTVITAEEIEALNVHTLAEVLNTIPGVQLDQARTPGSSVFFYVQGATNTHVQVQIDGVPQNDLADNFADVGAIPVQQIERVEVVKGAASAAWGQALGGVVNVVTKFPDGSRPVTGVIVSSMGEHLTTDNHGELSGTVNRFGYYLSGGNLHSRGLLDGNQVNRNNAYGKFTYDLPGKGIITLGADYRSGSRGIVASSDYDMRDSQKANTRYSFLNFYFPLGNQLILDISGYDTRKTSDYFAHTFDGQPLDEYSYHNDERTRGADARLAIGDTRRNLVLGLVYEHAEITQQVTLLAADLNERTMDRWGAYANGTLSAGNLTILPGIRFDDTGTDSDMFSYTLGATYRLTDKTVLRGYGARGYSLPSVLRLQNPEKVWTGQFGAESSDIPFLWLKGTLFYNYLWDIHNAFLPDLRWATRQGLEVEARTVPVYGLSLAAGYTYTDAWDRDTDLRLNSVPMHLLKVALRFDEKGQGVRSILTGSYVRWNADPADNAKDGAILWDFTISKKFGGANGTPELFFSLHNLFDASQYSKSDFKNTGRWIEGGVRFEF